MSGNVRRVRLLYKTILKLHRGLPEELQLLGNSYTRDEFRRHKTCSPAEATVFMQEWTKYALTLSDQLGLQSLKEANSIGDNLGEDTLANMREEQIQQLYDLLLASTAPREQRDV